MIEIIEDRPTLEVLLGLLVGIAAHALKERMPWRHPFKGRIISEPLLREGNLFILMPQFAKLRLKRFSQRPERPWHPADSVDMGRSLRLSGLDAGERSRFKEEIFNHHRYQPPLFGLCSPPKDRGQIQLP